MEELIEENEGKPVELPKKFGCFKDNYDTPEKCQQKMDEIKKELDKFDLTDEDDTDL